VNGETEENIRAEIDSLIREFCDQYDGDLSNDTLALFLTELRKLSEGSADCGPVCCVCGKSEIRKSHFCLVCNDFTRIRY
jgi:hypothetical protein